MTCSWCGGSGFIQEDTQYDYTRCIKCGRSSDVCVSGSDELLEERDQEYLAEKKEEIAKEFPQYDPLLPVGVRRCVRCKTVFDVPRDGGEMCPSCLEEGMTTRKRKKTWKNVTRRTFNHTLFARFVAESGLTREEIAFASNLYMAQISEYCTGKITPSARTVKKLCSVLGINQDDIFTETYIHDMKWASRFVTMSMRSKTEREKDKRGVYNNAVSAL